MITGLGNGVGVLMGIGLLVAGLAGLWFFFRRHALPVSSLGTDDTSVEDAQAAETVQSLLAPLAEIWQEPNPQAPPVVSGFAEFPEFLALYLIPQGDVILDGPMVLDSLLRLGLVYTEKKIFSWNDPETGEIVFEVASAFEPGIFEMDQAGSWDMQGLILFFSLPGPKRPVWAFEQMLDLAKKLAAVLHITVCDADRCPLSVDKILRDRNMLRAFEKHDAAHRTAVPRQVEWTYETAD